MNQVLILLCSQINIYTVISLGMFAEARVDSFLHYDGKMMRPLVLEVRQPQHYIALYYE